MNNSFLGGDKMCKHEKIFKKDTYLTSFPPKYLWECSKCGATGYDLKDELGKSDFKEWIRNDEFFKRSN